MSHVEKLCEPYPEHLGVIQLGHQHQALGGKDLSWLDDGEHLICFVRLAGLSLLQLNTGSHITVTLNDSVSVESSFDTVSPGGCPGPPRR